MKSPSAMLCLVTGHARSRRRSYVDPLDHKQRSYCRRCDAPMLKSWPEGWRPRPAHLHYSGVIHRIGEAGITCR